jgi:LPXTG-motif cell wall-anchored protein
MEHHPRTLLVVSWTTTLVVLGVLAVVAGLWLVRRRRSAGR